jgi:hypothetical protein
MAQAFDLKRWFRLTQAFNLKRWAIDFGENFWLAVEFVSHKAISNSFCKNQFPHKCVDLFFIHVRE